MKRKYGWRPEPPDHRDKLYRMVKPTVGLPEKVDLRPYCPPVEDQQSLGSCTANALVGALEFLELKEGCPFLDLSRLFVYWNERALEGSINEDGGAMIRDGIKTLSKQGVCQEGYWPYMISQFTYRPPQAAYDEAKSRVIQSYHRLLTLDDMLTCLAAGFPFVFGFTVFTAFEGPEVAKTGVLSMPGPEEKSLGGHAVVCVGYNQAEEHFIVRNSWGSNWAQSGYFLMPYEYMEKLSDDRWTIRK